MNDNNETNNLRIQQVAKSSNIPFLEELMSLLLEGPIQDIPKYEARLESCGLSRQSLFNYLVNLCQVWLPRERDIYKLFCYNAYINSYGDCLDKLRINPDRLDPDMDVLIKKAHYDFTILKDCTSRIGLRYFTKNIPVPFNLFDFFKTTSEPIKYDDHISQFKLFHVLRSASVISRRLFFLESDFNRLKHNIDEINKKFSNNLNQDVIEIINQLHCNVEKWLKKAKELTDEILPSQVFYLRICSFRNENFSEKDVEAYKEARAVFEEYTKKHEEYEALTKSFTECSII